MDILRLSLIYARKVIIPIYLMRYVGSNIILNDLLDDKYIVVHSLIASVRASADWFCSFVFVYCAFNFNEAGVVGVQKLATSTFSRKYLHMGF